MKTSMIDARKLVEAFIKLDVKINTDLDEPTFEWVNRGQAVLVHFPDELPAKGDDCTTQQIKPFHDLRNLWRKHVNPYADYYPPNIKPEGKKVTIKITCDNGVFVKPENIAEMARKQIARNLTNQDLLERAEQILS